MNWLTTLSISVTVYLILLSGNSNICSSIWFEISLSTPTSKSLSSSLLLRFRNRMTVYLLFDSFLVPLSNMELIEEPPHITVTNLDKQCNLQNSNCHTATLKSSWVTSFMSNVTFQSASSATREMLCVIYVTDINISDLRNHGSRRRGWDRDNCQSSIFMHDLLA